MGGGGGLEFGLLGPLEGTRDGTLLALGGAKQRALLAILLLNTNRAVSSDQLIDQLWAGKPPATAQTTLQVYVMQLRRLLEPGRGKGVAYEVLVTAPPGYVLRVAPDALDVSHFESLAAAGAQALADGDARSASRLFGDALALWRGPALADVSYESFAQTPVARLEELRLGVLEKRLEAELACGKHAELVSELQALCTEHPLREAPAGQLMLALYRSGRQAEALDAYQRTRRILVEELGIEPGASLQRLEREVLRHDPSLELRLQAEAKPPSPSFPERAVLLLSDHDGLDQLLVLARPLASSSRPHELLLTRALPRDRGGELAAVTEALGALRDDLGAEGVASRVAAFTSSDPSADILRLIARADVDLLLTTGPSSLLTDGLLGDELTALLDGALCDVAILLTRPGAALADGPILVPFGAGDHDWTSIELGAWLAAATGRSLEVLGTAAETDERDASRLLADASLLVQRASGVVPVAHLVGPGRESVIEAAAGGGLLVVGLSERWKEEGLGMTRWAIARTAAAPVLFVRRGLRPGGLAPDASVTRFAWSVTVGT